MPGGRIQQRPVLNPVFLLHPLQLLDISFSIFVMGENCFPGNKFAFLFLLAFLHLSVCGQNERVHLPEELILFLGNEVKLVIESNEILKIPTGKEQDSIFRNLLADIGKVQDSLSTLSVPLTIFCGITDKNSRKLEVVANSGTKAEFNVAEKSDIIASGFRNYTIECSLGKNAWLILYTNELSRLGSLNDIAFTELVRHAQLDISVRKIPARKVKTCSYKIENGTIDVDSADIRKRGVSVISPGSGFGISYIYDRFLANVSASVGYVAERQ